jgi:hypothetical protein|tara:strand:- start:35 stop:196 length:162 start_codon:yes stop_codon:yes gene_type:complete
MRIEFASIGIMAIIVKELQIHDINFECTVNDLGDGVIWIEKLEKHEVLAKIVA